MCSKTPSSRRRAFTLVEVLVTMAIGGIVMAALASMVLYTARSFATISNYVDLDDRSRTALDILTRDIRQVNSVSTFASNSVTFVDFDNAELTFTFDPNTHTLTRIKGNERKELLSECDQLTFGMFQRTTATNSYELISSTAEAEGKAISISWTCSRKILGSKVNTESVQTARVIIRKQRTTRY
jgi:prepilin-type N-terminal cleavage/methylation domain-containing protein